MRGPILACLFIAGLVPASAAEVFFPSPTDRVTGFDSLTYLDLVRELLPDLAPAAQGFAGSEVAQLRHLGGEGLLEVPAPDRFELGQLSAVPPAVGGGERLLVLFDLDHEDRYEGFAVLALFDLRQEPVLVDAAQVSYDLWTYFRDPATLPLTTDTSLVLTMSTHFNSSQSYVMSMMALARPDGLDFVDVVFTLDDRNCGYDRRQMPDFAVEAEEGGMPPIRVSVTETVEHTGDECGDVELPPAGTRTVAVTYMIGILKPAATSQAPGPWATSLRRPCSASDPSISVR